MRRLALSFALLSFAAVPAAQPATAAETAAQSAQRQLDREMTRDRLYDTGRELRGGAVTGQDTSGAGARADALDADRAPLLTERGLRDDAGSLGATAPVPMLGGNLPP